MIGRSLWCGRQEVRVGIALLVCGCFAALPGSSAAAGGDRGYTVVVRYAAPTCPSGKSAMHPLPDAKLVISSGSRTTRITLDPKGSARLQPNRATRRLRATVVLDGTLLSVTPYGHSRPYSIAFTIWLSPKQKTYTLTIGKLSDKAGAASVWAILDSGATLAQRSMPSGAKLPKVIARFDQGRGPGSGLPDLPFTETAYGDEQIFIDSRTQPDEYEPWVLLHEYGHHVLEQVASPGQAASGTHDLEHSYPGKPALAWSEGFAHAFAAIALKHPVLGTRCRTGVNLATTPATPRSKDQPWLNQYHEISIAGVLWGLASYFGGGDPQRGLKPLLAAFHTFSATYGGPRSLRDARDALIVGGLEQNSAARHLEIAKVFGAQKIYWGIRVSAIVEDLRSGSVGSMANWELHLVLRGPYPTCQSTTDFGTMIPLTGMAVTQWFGQIGAEGGLPYVSSDDCLVTGGNGQKPYDNPSSMLWLDFPYLAAEAHRSPAFTLTAELRCSSNVWPPGSDPVSDCTSDRQVKFDVFAGTHPVVEQHVSVNNGGSADVLTFTASGQGCAVKPSGADCSF